MINCSVHEKNSSPCYTVSSDRRSLRCKGENHPADNKVEEEDGVHDETFAVWRLTVCQESCRC